ncbi:mitogen-activated protein kinase kinase kinase 7 isoform X1 [Neodiprion fabricii]|uniref:mitogen-activated protein kinase kinase kinase 7 isoform X1 n=2 Tax=Neodiprion fabricii TaxID=2872261 RepID=UPI001ED96785|nr:mitogen-activated protein kinase kinase kinase 7 isoform X1 [Neodiprion fabricii]
MASKEGTGHQQQFVEEINYNEIETQEIVGKGSFGVVWKGRWRGQYVAVKHINSEGERKAFTVEVRQLSRVAHPNIVKLYGACTKNPVCLVMEYAEGGSLYNVLHCNPQPYYTAGHAMSWALQCARGVAYLHNMKPKPLIHRDLKPPNLLLILGGQTLKICDFGTACDLNTYMTNNKGSAAWMAPEVFEGSRYTEKCDVFSWGVILWEILSRRKPFDDIGGSAYRIMWAVHIGQRPPLMDGCPKPIEDLMTRCWKKVPEERPSMDEVVQIMSTLSEFFNGQLDPVEYSLSSEMDEEDGADDTLDMPSTLNSQINGSVSNGTNQTPTPTDNQVMSDIQFTQPETSSSQSQVPQTECNTGYLTPRLNQAGTQFLGLQNNSKPNSQTGGKTDLTPQRPPRGIPVTQRTRLSPSVLNDYTSPIQIECNPNSWDLTTSDDSSWEIRNMAGLDKMVPKTHKTPQGSSTTSEDLENVYRLLDAELRPLTPDYTCQQSREIFEEHKQLAQEYLKVQTEIALLGQHKNEMLKNLSVDSLRQQQELRKLEDEKESLVKLYWNLKRQLEIMKGQRGGGSGGAPVAMGSTVSGEDGWVVVPCQDPSRLS